jgi:Domain of unknown function (DUF4926)
VKNDTIKLLDVVALLEARPADGLARGQVGTVVEVYSAEAFEVEFLNPQGQTIALITASSSELLVLRHEPVATA